MSGSRWSVYAIYEEGHVGLPFYIGITTDVSRRVKEHEASPQSAAYSHIKALEHLGSDCEAVVLGEFETEAEARLFESFHIAIRPPGIGMRSASRRERSDGNISVCLRWATGGPDGGRVGWPDGRSVAGTPERGALVADHCAGPTGSYAQRRQGLQGHAARRLLPRLPQPAGGGTVQGEATPVTMLERAAKAMYEKNPTVPRGRNYLGSLEWDELGPWQKKAVIDSLAAALRFLREPDEAMIVAAYQGDTSRDHWQQMMDAILKDAP